MKNKALTAFLVSLSFIAAMILAVPSVNTPVVCAFAAIVVGIIPICIASFGVKDKKLTSKTLQPFIVMGAVAILRLFLDCLFFMILAGTGDYNVQAAYLIIQIILAVLLYVLEIVVLVFICLGKDVPVVGSFANKIVGIEEAKKAENKTKNKTNATEQEEQEEGEEKE